MTESFARICVRLLAIKVAIVQSIDMILPLVCRYGYKHDLRVLLEDLVSDMDKKIARQKERVAKECAPRELS